MSVTENLQLNNQNVGYSNKFECLKILKVLNQTLRPMEKEFQSCVLMKKNNKDYSTLYETFMMNECNFNKEKTDLRIKLNEIRQSINNFEKESKIIKPSHNIIDYLKKQMEQIDITISGYKDEFNQYYEELNNEEKLLTKEIEVYDNKISAWSQTHENNMEKNGKNYLAKNEQNSDTLKEVIEFDKFLLANNGRYGGWEEIDHNLFLKIRNKYKSKSEFLNELENLISIKTREQLEEHENWYKKFLILNEAKKQAIKNWRESKIATKSENVNLLDEEIKLNKEIEKELKNRTEKKKLMEKQELNKKLNEWKINSELDKAKENERKKFEEKKRLEKEEKERQRREEIKINLMKIKNEKKELNEYLEMEREFYKETERQIKMKFAKNEIKNFQKRDFENLNYKMSKQKAKINEKEEKDKRLEKMKEKFEAENDPNRLYKMTSCWVNRVNTPRSLHKSESCDKIITPNNIPHLAIPSWRHGVI